MVLATFSRSQLDIDCEIWRASLRRGWGASTYETSETGHTLQ
jgi:hypothetical protein